MTNKLAPRNRPGQLIRDAIADLVKQERNELVVIDMSSWHCSGYDGKCYQCLAGCVMSSRLGASITQTKYPEDFDDDGTSDKLYAINLFRTGQIEQAYDILGLTKPKHLPCVMLIASYDFDPKKFKKDMLNLADKISKRKKK